MDKVADFTLRKTHKNELVGLISRSVIPIGEFEWEFVEKETDQFPGHYRVPQLSHVPTNYYFLFDGNSCEYSPGTDNDSITERNRQSWKGVVSDFNNWLFLLKREIDAPDLWDQYQQKKEFAASLVQEDTDNVPFTEPERKQIAGALNDIKTQLVSMHHWNVQQAAIIDHQFKHMEESSNRIGRKDWRLFFYGAVMSVLINLAVTPEQGHAIFALAGTLIHPIFQKVAVLD